MKRHYNQYFRSSNSVSGGGGGGGGSSSNRYGMFNGASVC